MTNLSIIASVMLSAVQAGAPPSDVVVDERGGWTQTRDGVLVTTGDIQSCPYQVVGELKAIIRPSFLWSDRPGPAEAAAELRAQAYKKGGDAVIRASIGGAHASLFKIRSFTVRGVAVHFVDRSCAPRRQQDEPAGRTTGPIYVPAGQ